MAVDDATRLVSTALDFAAAHAVGDTRLAEEICLATDPYDLANGLASVLRGVLSERGLDPEHYIMSARRLMRRLEP
jgi:hypothetical protein